MIEAEPILARVLVAEDNPLLLLNLALMLQDLGAQDVRTARNAADALAVLDAMHVSLAVLDIQLGQDNGLVVADRCTVQGIPVILSTGAGEVPRPAMTSAILLTKPYTAGALQRAVAELSRRMEQPARD